MVKNPPAVQETPVWVLGWEDPLEKGKATHSSILAWRMHGLYSPWGRKESDTIERLSLSTYFKIYKPINIFTKNNYILQNKNSEKSGMILQVCNFNVQLNSPQFSYLLQHSVCCNSLLWLKHMRNMKYRRKPRSMKICSWKKEDYFKSLFRSS